MFKLRFDDAGKQIYIFPQDMIDNTILAFAVSPTTASGYAGASPTGKYFAPANRPELYRGRGNAVGDCGTGSLVVTGPFFQQHDIRFAKRTTIAGNVELRVRGRNAERVQPGRTSLPGQRHRQHHADRLPADGPVGHQHGARHPDRLPGELVNARFGNSEIG